MRRKLAAGNWKMNGTQASLTEASSLAESFHESTVDILLCPPATLLSRLKPTLGNSAVTTGGQTCHAQVTGAHTGEISAEMLKDAGADYVILGHSERRTDQGEQNDEIREKAVAAQKAGLKAVICIGETLGEREAQNTLDILGGQMSGSIPDSATGENLVIAYEPVWAIGTGLTPSLDQIGEVHDFMRARLERRFGEGVGRSVRLLYGGSVKPGNAHDIFGVSNVDGALVGGASLKAEDFSAIIRALEAA
ncbi:MAG: triose-phosphate isomerase [Pseudomonadota bacterium]